jgi:hypothetical protein
MDKEKGLRQKLSLFWPYLNERSRRLVAAAEALQLGRGGVSCLSRLSGLSRVTITKGIRELGDESVPLSRLRREGAGRPSLLKADPNLPEVMEALMEPLTEGDTDSPLRWTCKSTRALARELADQGRSISHEKVAQYLRSMDYSLQGNRNIEDSDDYTNRNNCFRHINSIVRRAMASKNPVISLRTGKQELIGKFDTKGRQAPKANEAEAVKGYGFSQPSIARAYPHGLYDLGLNQGFVNIRSDQDTGAFALASVRGWWRHEGRRLFPQATELLITTNSRNSNIYRMRNWIFELQQAADEITLPIAVCHFPPGIHKWNRVGYRLFSFISSNRRGEPLNDYATVVRLIAHTADAKGLAVVCRLDRRKYRPGRKVNNHGIAAMPIIAEAFPGEWNYLIRPRC